MLHRLAQLSGETLINLRPPSLFLLPPSLPPSLALLTPLTPLLVCVQSTEKARRVLLSMKMNISIANKLTRAAQRAQDRVRARLRARLAKIRGRKGSTSDVGGGSAGGMLASSHVFQAASRDVPSTEAQLLICYRVCHRVIWLLRHMLQGNTDTAVEMMQHVQVFIDQIGFDLGVEVVLHDLFSSPASVLEVRVVVVVVNMSMPTRDGPSSV